MALLAPVAFALATPPAGAQPAATGSVPAFVYATRSEARAVLGARDEYVRASTPLERSAKLKTAEPVDEERFARHMQDAAQEWTQEQRQRIAPVLEGLTRFLGGVKWRIPERILLIQAGAALEEDSPHTRANAIVMPASYLARGPNVLAHVLVHETFHVLTRNNEPLREQLYAAIGFGRCESVVIPDEIARLAITNPDTVESRHTIAVRYRGEPVEALPYIRFPSERVDPRKGFLSQLEVAWLLVDRQGTGCRAREGPQARGVSPDELEGLYEQIGRNTSYLFHPEEILAENFALLVYRSLGRPLKGLPSPEILDRMRGILLE